jgi:hypothetical protein
MAYVRLFLESNQIMVLSCSSEINIFDVTSAPAIVSLIISIVVLVINLIVLGVSVCYFCKHWRGFNKNKKFFFMEIYLGLKNKRWARFFTPALLIRRTLLVFIIIFVNFINRNYVFSVLLNVQMAYWAFLVVVLPYEENGIYPELTL